MMSECLHAADDLEDRKRYFIRSGGQNGVQVVTAYKRYAPSTSSRQPDNLVRDVNCRGETFPEEQLAEAAALRLSDRCLQARSVFTEARQRKAQGKLSAGEELLASAEFMMDCIMRAVKDFLSDHADYVHAKRARVRGMLSSHLNSSASDPMLSLHCSNMRLHGDFPNQPRFKSCGNMQARSTSSITSPGEDLLDDVWDLEAANDPLFSSLLEELSMA